MYYSFRKDLVVGEKYQAKAKKFLSKIYGDLEDGFDHRWDLKNDIVSFEVKTDFLSQKTGNVGIEYKDRGKPSGISVTESSHYFIIAYDKDWPMIVDGFRKNGAWLCMQIETSVLKELCKLPFRKRVRGGDDKQSLMVLIPLCDVREKSYEVFPLSKVLT